MTRFFELRALGFLSLASVLAYACGQSSGTPNNGNGDDGGGTGGNGTSSGGANSSGGASGSGSGGANSSGGATSSGSGGANSSASGSGSGGGTSSGGATSSGATSSSGGTSSSGSDSGNGGGDGAAPPSSLSVLQHHTNPSRDGVYTDPMMTQKYAKTLQLDTTFNPTITGNVYAQPLYVTPGPTGHTEVYVVATESNHVIVLDAATGAAVWDKTYGTPVTSGLACGTISPLGITGTPIIDPTSRTIYFDAMDKSSGAPKHMIHAVSLDNMGTEVSGWPIDVNAKVTGFNSALQNQRGALALLNGDLYVTYSGLNGDCGTYYGWVIGIKISSQAVTTVATGAKFPGGMSGSDQGGIWGPGGVASDGSASLFVTTGNTGGASTWSGGEAVLRLTSPGPTFASPTMDAFYPKMWASWDTGDSDLGSANAVVFNMPSGVQHLAAAFGKNGNMYLVNRDNLGGADGQLLVAAVGSQTGASYTGALNGAPAVYTTSMGTYVAFHVNANAPGYKVVGCANAGNLGVWKITPGSPPTAALAWCSAEKNLGSPMVTTTGSEVIVWDANDHLFGYDGDTGTKVFDGSSSTMASGMHYFNTPIGANGRIVVGTCLSNSNPNTDCPAGGPGHLYVYKP